MGFVGGNADRADFVAGDVPAAAQHRQDPAWIGVLAAAHVHLEPHDVVKAGTVLVHLRGALGVGRTGDQLFRLRQRSAVRADQRHGQVFGAALFQQQARDFQIGGIVLDLLQQLFHQPFTVRRADRFGRRCLDPFGRDARAAQHHFNPAAARERHDQHGGALLAGAAGAARTVLERFGIARNFHVHDQRDRRQIDPARGDVGGHANAGAAVAQCLQRVVAFVLAMLTRQRDGGEPALLQRGVQAADVVARGAEQDRGFRFVQAQQVDHGGFDVGRGNGDRLIADVAMPAIFAHGRNAQRIVLIAAGQRDNRLGHRRREQQRAAAIGRRVEDFFKVFAKAHVEHFVRFIEDNGPQARQLQRAAFQMVAQAARRANHQMRALVQGAAFALGVHPANAGGDPGAGPGIEPVQFARDLQRQFARRGDHQRQRRTRRGQHAVLGQQFVGHGEAKGHRLARTGLGGHDHVAAAGFIFQNRRLDGGEGGVAMAGQSLAQGVGNSVKSHISRKSAGMARKSQEAVQGDWNTALHGN